MSRANGIVVASRPAPVLRRYVVSGDGPRGPVSLVVDGVDRYDAIAEAKKIVRLSNLTAEQEAAA